MFNLSTRLKSILLFAILLVAFWIRIQSASGIPEGHFTGVDAYLYYFQAQHISEHGKLPERDMHRWLPVGRDNGQLLNLYSYVLAYTHKAVSAVFPNVTLYDVTVYMLVICFCMGLGALCLFLTRSFGRLSACLVGVLLATLPGAINRSTAGFGDRDAWCWMIGLLVVITYLASLQAETSRKRLFWTFISGFTVFLGGLSWEGFGVFLSVIIIVELWRFLTTETEDGLGLYALWVCCFVPTLYLASPAYRNGYVFAEHLFVFVLVPPVALLGIRALTSRLISILKTTQQPPPSLPSKKAQPQISRTSLLRIKNAQHPKIRTAQKQGASFFILMSPISSKKAITFRPLHGKPSRSACSYEAFQVMR